MLLSIDYANSPEVQRMCEQGLERSGGKPTDFVREDQDYAISWIRPSVAQGVPMPTTCRRACLAFGVGLVAVAAFAAEPADPLVPVPVKLEGAGGAVSVPPGFTVTLFAAPPKFSYPPCVAIVPQGGTAYVGCDLYAWLDRKPNRGRIVRCRDTDGDGVAETSTVLVRDLGFWSTRHGRTGEPRRHGAAAGTGTGPGGAGRDRRWPAGEAR